MVANLIHLVEHPAPVATHARHAVDDLRVAAAFDRFLIDDHIRRPLVDPHPRRVGQHVALQAIWQVEDDLTSVVLEELVRGRHGTASGGTERVGLQVASLGSLVLRVDRLEVVALPVRAAVHRVPLDQPVLAGHAALRDPRDVRIRSHVCVVKSIGVRFGHRIEESVVLVERHLILADGSEGWNYCVALTPTYVVLDLASIMSWVIVRPRKITDT